MTVNPTPNNRPMSRTTPSTPVYAQPMGTSMTPDAGNAIGPRAYDGRQNQPDCWGKDGLHKARQRVGRVVFFEQYGHARPPVAFAHPNPEVPKRLPEKCEAHSDERVS